MPHTSRWITITAVIALAAPTLTQRAQAASLGTKVIKGAAIGFLVTKTAKPLDKFINTITFRHGMRTGLGTKVVPILSVGEKGYIGGAQVSGPKSLVDRVDAVFQYEKNFSNNNYRAKVLLPSASLNPLKLERVPKVGVSAIIDVAVDGRLRYQTVGTGIHVSDAVRGAALLVAVKNMGKAINSGLNVITFNKGSVTKVVPMATFGEKTYLGGAQISASTSAINSVNALWQYEDLFSGGQFRVKVLVPTTSSNPLKMKRVDGAGVTAIIDMSLSQQKDLEDQRRVNRWGVFGKKTVPVVAYPTKSPKVYVPKYVPKPAYKQDNGNHKGWYKGKHNGRKSPQVDAKWHEKLEQLKRDRDDD